MTEIIDFTKALEDKYHVEQETLGEDAKSWTPADASKYALAEMERTNAEKCIVIWVSGETEDNIDLKYAVAGCGREDLLSIIVHIAKKLIMEWF